MKAEGLTWVTVCVLLLSVVCGKDTCPCKNKTDCKHPLPKEIYKKNKEVYVFSNSATNVEVWSWSTITTLVVPEHFNLEDEAQSNTMCIAHSKGRKFAITVTMSLTGQIDVTSNESVAWISSVVSKQQKWSADVVVLDMMPYFLSDKNSTILDHQNLSLILRDVLRTIKQQSNYSIELACIVPWKPPCAEEDENCVFTSLSVDGCYRYIINPDSFGDVKGNQCRARATIPLAKVYYGISEYASHHISFNRIILGVPWHGYDYVCKSLLGDICSLGDRNNCHINRMRLTLGEIKTEYKNCSIGTKYSDIYGAPFCNYDDENQKHQVWLEDKQSLLYKYRLTHELDLHGVAIMYGDDLSTRTHPNALIDDEEAWTWVTHEILLNISEQPRGPDFHMADTVTAVAISCLLVGVFLGFLFTCLALKKKVKKPRQPFARDGGTNEDEYMDDPGL